MYIVSVTKSWASNFGNCNLYMRTQPQSLWLKMPSFVGSAHAVGFTNSYNLALTTGTSGCRPRKCNGRLPAENAHCSEKNFFTSICSLWCRKEQGNTKLSKWCKWCKWSGRTTIDRSQCFFLFLEYKRTNITVYFEFCTWQYITTPSAIRQQSHVWRKRIQ